MTNRAAIYCRVSTDRQEREGASLGTQLQSSQQLCEGKGFVQVAHYTDVESGLNSEGPEYLKMLQSAQAGDFDALIVYRMDRLGRDTADYFTALRTLKRLNITVLSATEPTESTFVQGLFGLLGEEESRRLSHRIIPNKIPRARDGKWNGAAPIGYDVVKAPDGKGSILSRNADAPLVRELFRRYADGHNSIRSLCIDAGKRGLTASVTGVRWILNNRVYMGKVVYGRQSRSQFSKSESFEADGLHEPLVDEDLFQRVQIRLSENRHMRRSGPSPKYLLSGLLRCGFCGRSVAGARTNRRWVRYSCTRRVMYSDCVQPSFSAWQLEAKVKEQVQLKLANLELKEVRERSNLLALKQLTGSQSDQDQISADLRRRKAQAESRLRSLEMSLLDGLVPPNRYISIRDEIGAALREIDAELNQLGHSGAPDYAALFAIIDRITWDDLDDVAWRELLESLVEKVVLMDKEIKIDWLPFCRSLLAGNE